MGKYNRLASKGYGIKLISNSPSIDSACSSDDSDESNNEYCSYSSDEESELKKCRKITQSAWEGVAFQKPNKLPHDIDGLCCFKLKDTNRIRLLEKVHDGRSWKKDSRTRWIGYETLCYRGCKGQIKCPNEECNCFLQYKEPNRFHFAKDDSCKKYVVLLPLDTLVMPVNTLYSKEIKHIYSISVNTYVQQNRKQTLFLIMLKRY